ncbi:MAG TPA: pitrilysin family protein [Stellaceae bacterium]|nr:pitrilysin family protein [Stellaceae bacterium]
MLRLAIVALMFLVSSARAAQFEAASFTLGNGLQVVVLPSHRAPIVTQMVWYKVGAADEPRGTSGIAHFLEHLMFKGTEAVPPGAFSRIIAQNGGRDNAFTAHDYTAFYQNVAADRLELVMKLEADRMTGLVLDDKVVLPEREVILEERRTRIDNNPQALLNEAINAGLFLHHPYRIPVIGWEHEMHALSTADALAFYHSWYAPNNAVLVIAGDVEVAKVKELAEKYYGPVTPHEIPPRHRVSEPPKVAATRLVMKSSRAASPNWSRSYQAPSYRSGKSEYAYALEVLDEVMGGGATSRLYKSLVVDKGLALNAGAYYSPGALDIATFGFYATPRKGVSVADLEAAIEGEIRKVLEEGLTSEEVERAKRHMRAEAVFERDSLDGPARIVGAALVVGETLEDVQAWPERIGAVTLKEVNDAAHFVLHDETAATGVLLPDEGVP